MGVGSFSLPIVAPNDLFEYPSDWVNISNVPNNEIYLTTSDTDLASVAFTITTSAGTYNVDWGDGTQTTGITSNTIAQKVYTYGSGLTGTTLPGVTTFRCRIWATSGTITRFLISRNTTLNSFQSQCILAANFGTTGLTSMQNAFSVSSTTTIAYNLRAVYLPSSLNSCTTMQDAFNTCFALERCDMPVSMTGCTSFQSAFTQCRSLTYIKLPERYASTSTFNSMFNIARGLQRVDFPTVISGSTLNCQQMFLNCSSLVQCNLPTLFSGCTSYVSMFEGCGGLATLNLPTNMSGASSQRMFNECRGLRSISFPSSFNGGSDNSELFLNCQGLQTVTFASTTITGNVNGMFRGCNSLKYIQLPSNYTVSSSTAADMFRDCLNLEEITLPSVNTDSLNSLARIFQSAISLRIINNINSFGNFAAGSAVDGTDFIFGNENLTGITLNQRWSKLDIRGTSTIPTKITSIRLNNAFASQWGGASPQINVSWNSLGQAALVNLFNDLITVTAKTIDITGNPGAALLTPAERAIATGKGWTITG